MARQKLAPLGFTFLLTGCIPMCTEQHDPTDHHARIWAEQAIANAEQPKLAADGTLPTAGAGGAEAIDAGQLYTTYCSTCHGAGGGGDGPGAAALDPKPRNFHDAAWQNTVDDAHIAKVIKDGGASVGLSPTMAPWGAVLNEAQIAALVQHVRSFKQ